MGVMTVLMSFCGLPLAHGSYRQRCRLSLLLRFLRRMRSGLRILQTGKKGVNHRVNRIEIYVAMIEAIEFRFER